MGLTCCRPTPQEPRGRSPERDAKRMGWQSDFCGKNASFAPQQNLAKSLGWPLEYANGGVYSFVHDVAVFCAGGAGPRLFGKLVVRNCSSEGRRGTGVFLVGSRFMHAVHRLLHPKSSCTKCTEEVAERGEKNARIWTPQTRDELDSQRKAFQGKDLSPRHESKKA